MAVIDSERLAVLETEVTQIKGCVETINGKLDRAIEQKADMTYVEAVDTRVTELRGWLWGLVIATGLSLLATVTTLLLALVRAAGS